MNVAQRSANDVAPALHRFLRGAGEQRPLMTGSHDQTVVDNRKLKVLEPKRHK